MPLRIVAGGFLPGDDVLRHVAKAVTGRDWRDVLVLAPDVTMDSHPGWHALLSLAHRLTHATAPDLAVLSVVGLFVLVSLPPLLLLRRPEAWLGALLVAGLTEPVVLARLFLGRPFLVSLALLITLCLLVPRQDSRVRLPQQLALLAAFGVVAWIHPSWHLFLCPFAPVCSPGVGAQPWPSRTALAGGVVLAGLLHGHPIEFLDQSLRHTYLALGSSAPPGTLVFEFSPGDGAPLFLLVAAAVLLWRRAFDASYHPDVGSPVSMLAAIGWLLGFGVSRFWTDWGAPAALVWLARELEGWFETRAREDARARLALAGALAVGAFVVLTANVRGRWLPLPRPFAALAAPAARPALPEPGGIIYTAEGPSSSTSSTACRPRPGATSSATRLA